MASFKTEGDFHIKGMKEMRKMLLQLKVDDKKKQQIVHNALKAGAREIRKVVKRNAPGDRIWRSFKMKVGRGFNMPTVEFGMGGPKAPHAHLVEFGTSAHVINIEKKKALSDGATVFGTVVHHPGSDEKPFFRPALITSAEAAGNAFAIKMGKEIAKTIKKYKPK